MRFKGFIGPSYISQSLNVDCQRCINMYLELDESGEGKSGETTSLVSTPGLSLLATLPKSPVRGAYTDSKKQLWAVGGNTLYQISSSWVATSAGTLNTSIGPVNFMDNGTQGVVVDGTYGYYWDLLNYHDFQQITDSNFYASDTVTFIDSYLIFVKKGTTQFFFTGLNQVVPFNGLDTASAESSPDNLIAARALQENLYLFSENHLEVWYNSGDNSNPFQRIQGGSIEIGIASAFSLSQIQTSLYWLGKDKNGQATVYRIQGLIPERISTYSIENQISKLSEDLSTSRSWTYYEAGHFFYCLNIPNANTTWCYDSTNGTWHERTFLTPQGTYQRHLADCHAFAYNKNVVGDYSSGNLYSLDQSYFSDNGNPIRRERITPYITQDLNRIFHVRIQLDMQMGVGLDGTVQGSNPQVMLMWSDDFGNTWSNEIWVSAGKIGARLARAIWNRLGTSRNRVYRVQITDPVSVTFIGAEIDVREGTN